MASNDRLCRVCLAGPAGHVRFFEAKLGWSFEWFGPDFVAFHGARLEGSIYRADTASQSADGGALIVFYSRDLEASEALILSHEASIIKPIFDLLGGCRFQFAEPAGSYFAC